MATSARRTPQSGLWRHLRPSDQTTPGCKPSRQRWLKQPSACGQTKCLRKPMPRLRSSMWWEASAGCKTSTFYLRSACTSAYGVKTSSSANLVTGHCHGTRACTEDSPNHLASITMSLMIRELKSAMFLHMQAGKHQNDTPKALPQNTGNIFVTFSYNGGGGGWAASAR